jgi:glycerophosphoryl diester phosphodiesterase
MRCLRLGHRGTRFSPDISENTLAAFELCLQMGCDGFEFDLRLSGDGKPVVIHDAISRGASVAANTARDLELPTLAEVLQRFSARAFLDIELKVPGLEAHTVANVRSHPPTMGLVVSSFLPDVLATMRCLDPTIELGFLCETEVQLRDWRRTPAEWVIPQFELVNRELIDEVHGAGKRIMVWTVNQVTRMAEFAEWGADALISDEIGLMNDRLRS